MDVFDLFAKISLDTSEFERGLDNASKKFNDFSKKIKGISDNFEKVSSGLKDLVTPAVEGFKAVEKVGKTAGDAVVNGLKGFAAASTAVAGFGTAAVKAGMSFDSTMSEVSAISGATGQDFQDLRDKALEMGAKTKFSASEAAEAMTYMGMAGWKTQDMLGGIEGIMNLAAASGEDLATTSDIVTDALTAFGMKASESGHFADVMAVAATNANTNVGMMGETFKYVAPVAGSLGYTVEDTSLAIGLMANSSIKASQAGTSLRSIMTRLATNAGRTKTELGALDILTEELGVDFYDTEGNARALGDVLMEARDAWQGLGDEEATYYAKKIAGQEAISGWLAIMNASTEDVDKLTVALENANGAAEEMSRIMVDNLQGDLTLLGSAAESLQIAISDSLTPTLREFAQFGQTAMVDLLEGFQGGGVSGFMSALTGIATDSATMLAEKAPLFVDVSLQFVDAMIDGLLGASDAIFSAGEQIISKLVGFLFHQLEDNRISNKFIDAGKNIIELVASGFLQAGKILSMYIDEFVPLIAEGFLKYHETLFTVGLDILGAIGQGLVENKDELNRMASETVANMVIALRDNAPAIIEGAITLLEAFTGAIIENLPLIMEAGAEIMAHLVAGISTSMPALIVTIGAIIPEVTKVIDVIGGIGGVFSSVAGLVQNNISAIMSIGSKLIAGIQVLFTLITAHPVVAVVTAIITAVTLLWTHCEGFRDFVKGMIESIVGFFQSAAGAVQAAWSTVSQFFSGIANGIYSAFETVTKFLGSAFQSAWDAVQNVWSAAGDFFSGIADGIHSVFETVTQFLGDAFSAAWNAVQSAWSAAKGFFSDIWNAIKEGGSSAAEAVSGALKKAWDAIKSVWGGVTGFFKGIFGDIIGVFSNIGGKFLEIGGNIVNGLKKGISNAWNNLTSFISGKISGIVDTVKNKLGIHSPSTVFAGIGGNMALGLSEGWADQYSSIKSQIERGMDFGTASIGLTANGAGYSFNETGVAFNQRGMSYGEALQPVTIVVQSVLNERVIGETSYQYMINRERAYGGR